MRTQNSPAIRTSFLATFLICSTVALFLWRLARFFIYPIAPDQISYLVEAQRLLSGVKPYGPHLAEVSPPLIIWFSALPTTFTASMTSISPFAGQLLGSVNHSAGHVPQPIGVCTTSKMKSPSVY